MKTKIILLNLALPLFFLQIVNGQGYIPLLDTAKQWNVMFTTEAGGSPASKSTQKYQISVNDTLINDTIYKKVLIAGNGGGAVFPLGVIGFIREDTAERKVYFREKTQMFYPPKDRLLYDFSLTVGDSVEIFGLHHCTEFSNKYKVVSINTIALLNGEERKTWQLVPKGDYTKGPDQWIEGIGSLNGLLFPGCYQLATLSFSLDLLCYYEDGVNLYISVEDTCYVDWTTGLETKIKHSIKVSPNPVLDLLTLSFPNEFDRCYTYQIFSMSSTKVADGRFCGKTVSIPVSKLKTGMYYILLKNESIVLRIKFITNN